ncbi:MAG: hypothetical protein DMF79_19720 [Acidobacteria bacterium]|nr:MAG: hypothetical protein DMF79_19720 [Acidobacteriota bacterium]
MVADTRSPSAVGVTTRVHPATRVGQQGGIDARGAALGGSTEKETGFGVTESESAGEGPGVLLPQPPAPSRARAPATRTRFPEGTFGIGWSSPNLSHSRPREKAVHFPSVHAGGRFCPEGARGCRPGGDGRCAPPCRRGGAGHLELRADALTDLPNRLLFTEHLSPELAQARRQSRPLAVLFLDLDHFKVINDTLGHAAGDRLLQEVAQRLRSGVRLTDTVARVGSDEFTILLAELASPVDATRVAEKLLQAVAGPVVLGGRELSVTASIGIALYPSDGNDAESLLQNADLAMYRAKEGGRNHYELSSPTLNASKALERLSMENSIWRGLEGQEFELYYQPSAGPGPTGR